MNQATAKSDGVYMMVLGAAAFLLVGLAILNVHHTEMMDFKSAFFSARCLIKNYDPYAQSDLMRLYVDGGERVPSDVRSREILDYETRNVYLPISSTAVLPFAILPYHISKWLWLITISACFIVACCLMWNLGATYSPRLAGALLCFYLFNSGSLISSSNAGGLALSLGTIASWCFIEKKFPIPGVLAMAMSLALKPHLTGLVWLYFLVAGRTYRRRALQSLAVVVVVSIPTLLWIMHTSPHWIAELRSNMASHYGRGAVDDQGPATVLNRGTFVTTNLQAVLSFISDRPTFYNWTTCVVCFLLLALLIWPTAKRIATKESMLLGLAPTATLSMLPLYHRQYDAKILILTVPACALIWSQGGRIAKVALAVEFAGLALTGDLPWALIRPLIPTPTTSAGYSEMMIKFVLAVPVPLELLVMTCFFTWLYLRTDAAA